MREQFIILEFPLIVLFILIGEIFLIININSFLGSWLVSSFYIDPVVLCTIIPIKVILMLRLIKLKFFLIIKINQVYISLKILKMVNAI